MDNNYKIKFIKTKNKLRKIVTYENDLLKKEHQYIVKNVNLNFEPSIFSKGYIKNESIYTNAKAHLYNDYFIKTDIKNFFISINHNVLKKKIYKELNHVMSPRDCDVLLKKCTVSGKGLPLGLITSPVLSNIYLKDFDIGLYKKLSKLDCNNIIYTRYADDMVISFGYCLNPKKIYKKIIIIIEDLLKDYYLNLNSKKTKFIYFAKTKQVKITGVNIVEKNGKRRLSVGRNNKRKLFYDSINYKKNQCNDVSKKKRLKGKLAFYLSIEKTNFEDFITKNMRCELEMYGYDNFIDFMKEL